MKIKLILCGILLCLTALYLPAAGFDVIPSQDYNFPDGSDLPEILNINQTIECGDYSFRLTHQPIVSKSMNAIVGDLDFQYLIVRGSITNNSERTIGWLTPDSFSLTEVFRNQEYGTYPFDPIMSAKGAVGYSVKAFYTPIEPGASLQTVLVFNVFPDADGWIFNFSPHILGETTDESIRFMLPKAYFQ